MFGHTNIKTTQIYARITDQKVNKDMDMLAEKLNGVEIYTLKQAQLFQQRQLCYLHNLSTVITLKV